jgi:Fe-S cluster biogenesis protein NfuA
MTQYSRVFALVLLTTLRSSLLDGFVVPNGGGGLQRRHHQEGRTSWKTQPSANSDGNEIGEVQQNTTTAAASPAPVLNGKRVLPLKIMFPGLKGHEVAAAYAIYDNEYKSSDWKACQHVGITRNLEETLQAHLEEHGSEKVAFVRALSFIIPNEGAMESIASDWRKEAIGMGGKTNFDPVLAAMEQDFDEEDDDDDFDEDDDDSYFEMMADAMSASRSDLASARGIEEPPKPVVSPFDQPIYATTADGQALEFTRENVDKVLEEIRPYLISDGGNVSVERVDETTRNVYLKLEGACGSCPSSTVTMQMGIERVLKENFKDLGEVIRVEEEGEEKPTELTYQVVEQEVNRIKPAIVAMGGLVDIVSVDPIGVVEIKFRGANKVRQGVELALLDIDFVKHVKFVMDD